MSPISRIVARGIAAACLCAALACLAQAYPAKPVHLVIPFPPGSSLDLIARSIGAKMEPSMGQKFVIEHRGGGGNGNGMVGAESLARSAPEGYTLMFTTPSSQVSPVYLTRFVSYDPRKDFTPIAGAVEAVIAIAVHPTFPADSVKKLIDYAKKNPGKISYGSSGNGSYFHLLGEFFNEDTVVNIVHVPYKNIAAAGWWRRP